MVELPEFLRRAKAIMAEEERAALVSFVAANPEAGISLGGGLRKLRFARPGGGKSGGYRTVCIWRHAHADLPRHRVREEREGRLGKAEQAELVALSKGLIARYGDKP